MSGGLQSFNRKRRITKKLGNENEKGAILIRSFFCI
jgi:hypothetical protein